MAKERWEARVHAVSSAIPVAEQATQAAAIALVIQIKLDTRPVSLLRSVLHLGLVGVVY